MLVLCLAASTVQPDTSAAQHLLHLDAPAAVSATGDSTLFLPSPRGALWRAAAAPGWGQAYNRQYGKLPFVYAAIGGLAATVVVLNNRYLLYRRAYQFKAFDELTEDGEINPRQDLEVHYLDLLERRGVSALSASAIRPTRDALRRNRDLAILGTGLVYGLSILDAYVSAHLMDFDISDDLTVSVVPMGRNVGARLAVSL